MRVDKLINVSTMESELRGMTTAERGARGGWPLAATLAVGLLLIYALRYVLLPFVAAGALAYVVEPATVGLQRRLRAPRWLAVVPVYVGCLTMFVGLGYLIGWRVATQVHEFSGSLRGMLDQLLARLMGGDTVSWGGQQLDASQLANHLVDQAGQWLGSAGTVTEAAQFALWGIGGCGLTLVLLVYFMLGGSSLVHRTLYLAPPAVRPRLRDLLRRLDPLLGRYVRGLFLIVGLTWFLAWLGIAFFLQVRGAVLLALATGMLELVPVVGPVLSIMLISVAALEHGQIAAIIKLSVYCIGLRLVIDQVLGPLILGQAARLQPLAVLFSFVVGGALFGPLGLFLAVPVAATIKLVLSTAYRDGDPLAEPKLLPLREDSAAGERQRRSANG